MPKKADLKIGHFLKIRKSPGLGLLPDALWGVKFSDFYSSDSSLRKNTRKPTFFILAFLVFKKKITLLLEAPFLSKNSLNWVKKGGRGNVPIDFIQSMVTPKCWAWSGEQKYKVYDVVASLQKKLPIYPGAKPLWTTGVNRTFPLWTPKSCLKHSQNNSCSTSLDGAERVLSFKAFFG